MTATEAHVVAPPWQLTGEGHIFIYRFPESFINEQIPPFLRGKFKGGLGTVMLVNYATSPVGPYQELLFIPGMFDVNRKWTFSITTIFVSTNASVVSGRANWGIPKQLADFEREMLSDNRERIRVTKDGVCFFDIMIQNGSIKLPFNTSWLPIKAAIIQQTTENKLLTQPSGKGRIKRTNIETLTVDHTYFPNIAQFKPIVTINVPNFTITFPNPKVMEF